MKAIYIRTSTTEQNPENQISDIELMSNKDYSIFKDKQSAWKEDKERPDFERLLNHIKASQVSDLYVWDLDRLYRKRLRVVEFFKLCKAYKCNIHSYRQSWLEAIYKIPSPWNEIVSDFLIQMMGWLAEEESNKKSERVKAAKRDKNGITFSYKGNKWGRKELNNNLQEKIEILREQGNTMRFIAKELNISIGVVHKYLVDFDREKIQKMLSSLIEQLMNSLIECKGKQTIQNDIIPLLPGIYCIFNQTKELIYIGKAKNLRTRIAQHNPKEDTIMKNTNIPFGEAVYCSYFELENQFKANQIEEILVKKYMPKYNEQYV